MGKIPDRWEEYKPYSKTIAGTRFLPFKVPLKKEICGDLSDANKFTPDLLLKQTSADGMNIGLIIDLTNTTRYYKKEVIINSNIEYRKIFTEGHVVPSSFVRSEFFAVVDEFLKKNAENDLLIGTHCTHGINRTGYLICRYMIDRLNISPDETLEKFEDARGYPVERQNYIEDLKTGKCHEDKEYSEDVTPELYRKKEADFKVAEIDARPTYDNKQTYSSFSSKHRPSYISNSRYNRNFDGYDIPKRNGPRFFCPVPLKYLNVPNHDTMYENYCNGAQNQRNSSDYPANSINDNNCYSDSHNDRLSANYNSKNDCENGTMRNQYSQEYPPYYRDSFSQNHKMRNFNRSRTSSDNDSLDDSHLRSYSQVFKKKAYGNSRSARYDNSHSRDERSWSCPSSIRKK